MKTFNRFFTILVYALLMSWILPACKEKPIEDHEEIVRSGLAEILAHQESGCEEIMSWEIDDRFDYLVSCENGMKFRIHVGNEGHVNVEEHRNASNQR